MRTNTVIIGLVLVVVAIAAVAYFALLPEETEVEVYFDEARISCDPSSTYYPPGGGEPIDSNFKMSAKVEVTAHNNKSHEVQLNGALKLTIQNERVKYEFYSAESQFTLTDGQTATYSFFEKPTPGDQFLNPDVYEYTVEVPSEWSVNGIKVVYREKYTTKGTGDPVKLNFTMKEISVERKYNGYIGLGVNYIAESEEVNWELLSVKSPILRVMDKASGMVLFDVKPSIYWHHSGYNDHWIPGYHDDVITVYCLPHGDTFYGALDRLSFQFIENPEWEYRDRPAVMDHTQPIYDEHCNVIG